MAITPEEAGRIGKDEESIIREAEHAVELRLKKDYQGHGSVSITEPLERLTDRCRREVLSRFRGAGWNIEKKHHEGDQRDPRERSYDSWEFSAGARDTGLLPSHDWRDR